MVKRADIRVQVPRCSAQTFWDVVYEKPEATERYHLSYNESSAPSATDWSAGQRRVSFRMPLSLPELVKRMVGLESVEVTEVQRVVWGGSGSFTVSSETHVTNLMGASRFTTALQLTATEQPEEQPAPPASAHPDHAGCASPGSAPDGGAASAACSLTLVYSVRCGASSVPWPMSATIENIMAEKALVSMQFFLDFCTQLLDEHQAVAAASSAAERSAAAAAASSPGALETDADSGAVAAAASGAAGLQPPIVRRRWPSITCSQDLAPTPPSPTALLHHTHHQQQLHHLLVPLQRQQQQHGPGGAGAAWYESASAAAAAAGGLSAGGDVAGVPADAAHPNGMALRPQPSIPETDAFLDAREAFGASSSASGYSSDGQTLSPTSTHRAQGGTGATSEPASAAGAPGTADLAGITAGGSQYRPLGAHAYAPGAAYLPSPQLYGYAADATTAAAFAMQGGDTARVAMAVEKLTAAVSALDQKLDRVLAGAAGGRCGGGAAAGTAVAGGRMVATRGDARGSGGGGSRWWLRVVAVLLLANLLVVGMWLLNPHATGLRPHPPQPPGPPPAPAIGLVREAGLAVVGAAVGVPGEAGNDASTGYAGGSVGGIVWQGEGVWGLQGSALGSRGDREEEGRVAGKRTARLRGL